MGWVQSLAFVAKSLNQLTKPVSLVNGILTGTSCPALVTVVNHTLVRGAKFPPRHSRFYQISNLNSRIPLRATEPLKRAHVVPLAEGIRSAVRNLRWSVLEIVVAENGQNTCDESSSIQR